MFAKLCRITHFRPEGIQDKLAYAIIKACRAVFDVCSGYALGRIDERGWLNRIVFLETVAGVPGMIKVETAVEEQQQKQQ